MGADAGLMEIEVREADYADAGDRKEIRRIRREVFVKGQKVRMREDFDGEDEKAVHVLAFADGKAVGTARVRAGRGIVKFERMAVLEKYRGRGVGKAMLEKMVAIAQEMGAKEAVLGAQLHALGFYELFGFKAEGPVFMDARMEHKKMRRRL